MHEDWLKEGDQTKATPYIKKIAEKFKGNNLNTCVSIVEWLLETVKLENDKKIKSRVFRKRTAEKIIKDGFGTGCSDFALAFIALARAKGIPTKYVEGISMKWLDKSDASLEGHVWAEVFANNNWYIIDAINSTIHFRRKEGKLSNPSGYIVLDKGLDSWSLGIKSFTDLKKKIQQLQFL
ncbi:MAG: transglutaminase-like domain-containing protein [archaeon]